MHFNAVLISAMMTKFQKFVLRKPSVMLRFVTTYTSENGYEF